MCEICQKLAIKTPERRHGCHFNVFIVRFEQISHIAGVSIVDFEKVNTAWVGTCTNYLLKLRESRLVKLKFAKPGGCGYFC